MPAKSSYQGVLLGGKQCSEPLDCPHQSGPQHAVTPVKDGITPSINMNGEAIRFDT